MPLIYPSSDLSFLRLRRARGVTMVEVMLSLAVASLMLLMLSNWLRSANDDLRAKRNADSLQQFTQIALQYLDANRAGIVAAMSAPNKTDAAILAEAAKYCVFNGNTAFNPWQNGAGEATCAVGRDWLVAKKLLPAGSASTNPYGQNWVAIYRLVYADYDGAGPNPVTTQGDVEVLVAATGGDAIPNNELGMTMQLLGGLAGMYPATITEGSVEKSSIATCADGYICGPGGWTVKVSDFKVSY